MVGEQSKEGNKALEETVGKLFNHNGEIVTKEQKDALDLESTKEKSIEEQANEAYANHLQQYGFFGGMIEDIRHKGSFFREFYASRGLTKDAKQAEDKPKTAVGRAFKWFDAKYSRAFALNLIALAVVAGLYYLAGKPIWENAEAKNKAAMQQSVEQYLRMDKHRVEAKPQSLMYQECIEKDTKLGFEAYRAAQWIMNRYEVAPENWKEIVASEKWKSAIVPEGRADGPCNRKDAKHISERTPAPKIEYTPKNK